MFHPVGIAARDGTIAFSPPRTKRTVNYSPIDRGDRASSRNRVEMPVKRLETIAGELGHDHVDLLKLDIEGGEYEVIPDLLASPIQVHQLLLEVHHGYPSLSFADTRTAIESLRAAGYRIFDISRRGREFSLLKTPCP